MQFTIQCENSQTFEAPSIADAVVIFRERNIPNSRLVGPLGYQINPDNPHEAGVWIGRASFWDSWRAQGFGVNR